MTEGNPAMPAPDTTAAHRPAPTPVPKSLPTAKLERERRASWAWLLPLAAVAFSAWLGYRAWIQRGIMISVQLDSGHGLKAGDDVRYRGIGVGTVDSVSLLPDLKGVVVKARLTSDSENLARSGSRFWVVRPQLHLTRIEGIETLIGPRFLAALPGPSKAGEVPRAQRSFVGLNEPPIVEDFQSGDLEIILQAQHRGSLHPGAPVTYRQSRVGTILSVGLTGDGGAVEARTHIQQPYVQLIRPRARFWDVGGLEAKLGFSGVSVEIESAEALLIGGVALATPPPDEAGGEVVRTGHRFILAEKPEKEWLDWQPLVAIGSSMLPPGMSPPSPLRATLGWSQGRWISRGKSRSGWVLQTSRGLLGPTDLLKPEEKADPESVVLEVNGQVVPLSGPPRWEAHDLALLDATVAKYAWPLHGGSSASEPEDCLAIADPSAAPLPLAAARLHRMDSADPQWRVDPAVPIDQSWHGASIVSRSSGRLVGILLVDEDDATVSLLPPRFVPDSTRTVSGSD
jgi:hypothetical protein